MLIKAKVPSIQINGGIAEHLSVLQVVVMALLFQPSLHHLTVILEIVPNVLNLGPSSSHLSVRRIQIILIAVCVRLPARFHITIACGKIIVSSV